MDASQNTLLRLIGALGRCVEWNPSLTGVYPSQPQYGMILALPSLANNVVFGLPHDQQCYPCGGTT